jgi:hypothetical protein
MVGPAFAFARTLRWKRAALVKIGGNWYRVIGVLTTEVSGAPDSSDEQATPESKVTLPITHTSVCHSFPWGPVERRVAVASRLRLER